MSDNTTNPNPISQEAVDAAVAEALAAFSAAESVAALKAARTEHVGDDSAIAKLNALMREFRRTRRQ